MKHLLNTTLLLLALLLPATATAHDFEVDGIYYSVTSYTTVKVSGYNSSILDGNVEIPDYVTNKHQEYDVTAIADSAFYGSNISSVRIPEYVTSIGIAAFKNCPYLRKIISLPLIPPLIEDSFDHNKISYDGHNSQFYYLDAENTDLLMLYVNSDAYSNYKEINDTCHYFDFINCIGSNPTNELQIKEEFKNNCLTLTIIPGEESVIYYYFEDYAPDFYNPQSWQKFNSNEDCVIELSVLDTEPVYWRYMQHGFLGFFAVAEGKEPSGCVFYNCDAQSPPTSVSYDFEMDNIYYYFDKGSIKITCGCLVDAYSYYISDGGYIALTELSYSGTLIIPRSVEFENQSYQVTGFGTDSDWDCFWDLADDYNILYDCSDSHTSKIKAAKDCLSDIKAINIEDISWWCNLDIEELEYNPLYYSHKLLLNNQEIHDIIIPDDNTSINNYVFAGWSELTSIVIPSSVTSIGKRVFEECPNLEYIKCLGATPPSAYDDSFDEGVYQNTTLYVPIEAINAYRNAEGWKNFQNIVGFIDYDFVVDGIYYSMTSDQEAVVVHGEEAYQGNVIIPGTVTYEGTTYTVTGIGSGAFANATVNCLSLPVDVINNIASDAFEGSNIQSVYITGNGAWTAGALPSNVENLYIGSGVTAVPGLQVNPTTIYSYATVPPTCDENSFTGYDASLHVPASSLASYFTASYWSNFINIVGDAIEPTAVTLNSDSISILIGNQVQLTATIEPENATPNQILWASSDEGVATVVDGMIQAVAVGECDIKAWLLDKSAVCHVTVTEIAPTEVTLNQTFAKLEIGSQLSLTATVLPDDATDKVITWTTSNSAVATVDSLGNVIAVGPGECSITASCRDKQATCHVIVVEHLIFITLDQHELSVLPNHIEMLTPSVSPVSTDLRVTSSDPAVAAARLANGKIQVVGITEGTTTITIGSVDGYAEPDSCVVTVYTERGDVNNDGFVNITDAIDLINDILNDASASFYTVNADCNNDGEVNISDVMRLINYILSGAELEPKETTDPTQAETETITVNGVSFTMVKVDGGSFMMGCAPEQNSEAGSNEAPVHRVTLSTYYMGQTEVTQELWQAVMGSNPSNFANDAQNPVEKVTWNDCQEFISQLNQLTGKTFRLPTEAEWEFAACGGNKSHGYTYSGSNDINEIAWFSDNSENTTHPVGLKKANELGLFDMTGNVYEWCYDRYGYYPEAPQTDPQGPETGSSKIYRGGGWMSAATSCRNTRRNFFAPGAVRNFMGLRLVMVP